MTNAANSDIAAQIAATNTKMDAIHAELSGSISDLRVEMRAGIKEMRTEMNEFKAEMRSFRTGMSGFRTEMEEFKTEMRSMGMQIEQTNAHVQAILEVLVPMRQDIDELKRTTADIPEIKQDIQIIKAALKQTNADVQNHEIRITRLETNTA